MTRGSRRARTASSAFSSKRTDSPIRSAFPRQVPPLRREAARHCARSLATGEPASDALSPSPMRCIEERARPANDFPSYSPGHLGDRAPLVDFCNRLRFASTTARSIESYEPSLGGAPREGRLTGGFAFFKAQPAEMSRVRGRRHETQAGASRRDRSRRKLRPNPIGPDTSCRKLVGTPAWSRRIPRSCRTINKLAGRARSRNARR